MSTIGHPARSASAVGRIQRRPDHASAETDGDGEAALQRVGVISSATFTALVEDLVAGTRPGDADAQK